MPICKILPLSQLCFSLGVAKAYNSSAAAKWWSNMEQPKILKAGRTMLWSIVESANHFFICFHCRHFLILFVQLLHQIRFTHLRALKWVEIVSCRQRFRAGWLNSRTELQCSVLLTIHTVEIRDVFRSFQSSAMWSMCMSARVILEQLPQCIPLSDTVAEKFLTSCQGPIHWGFLWTPQTMVDIRPRPRGVHDRGFFDIL